MSQRLFRIATDTKTYTADDMTGTGAKLTGGRWNDVGVAVVYASPTRALACLETLVHLNAGGLPLNRYLVEIEVPADLWAAAESTTASSLPIGWDAEPAGLVSTNFGTDWANSGRSALLMVPSVIIPEELNVLINPGHPDAGRIAARKVRKWIYDPRMDRRA
ncbi:RES family NAD+ phosphorylase [Sphingomonas beigongshangi]|uniref:RES family NAD+ phosphorylase n=1 Tax=Sphingomonas beigongshangi TaxID=2782540 RepID=UPI001AED27B4